MTTLPQPASALQAVFRVTQLPAWCRFGWPPIAAALVLAVLVLATAAAYLYIPHDPIAINPLMRLKPASADHWLGTDALGRDVFSRVMAGGQVSLLVGVAAAVISIAAGLCIGLVSGFFRVLDGVVMRITDAVMSVPSILLAIALVALNGPSIWSVIIAITVPEVPRVVRLVRSVVLSAREEPYVEAAPGAGHVDARHSLAAHHAQYPGAAHGAGHLRLRLGHPDRGGAVVPGAGVSTEIPTWGNIMAEARMYFQIRPGLMLWPGLLLSLCILSINLLGDTARDMLDPRLKRRGSKR